MVVAALEVPFSLHIVDLKAEEHLKADFLKINPQHTVPTIVDDGFCLWESRAIAIARYLVNRYGEGSSLYPSDPQHPQLLSGAPPNKEQARKLEEALKVLDKLLENDEFAAGPELTLADFVLVASVSTIDAAGIELAPFLNIKRWFEFVKDKIPGYEKYNTKGLEEFKKLIKELKKVRSKAMAQASKRKPSDTT